MCKLTAKQHISFKASDFNDEFVEEVFNLKFSI